MANPVDNNPAAETWVQAWPDALAFAVGLGLAWFLQWETTDLVWSLWLSSLVVGYATIFWTSTRSLREFTINVAKDRGAKPIGAIIAVRAMLGAGALLVLAFFTVHFGGFHLGHSIFLNMFFPVADEPVRGAWPGMALYVEVVRRYWIFLPVAFLAERAAFRPTPEAEDDGAVTAAVIAARKAAGGGAGSALSAPYRNVVRMHLLIFFFAGAHFAKLDNFLVYAVVYAVYFFPWRLVRSSGKQ